MKINPQVTIDQWRVFHAIIDEGGYAQAASYLHRSQSAISYSISRLQMLLGITLLKVEGRKARLTEPGQVLLPRSRQLIIEAWDIESLAQQLSKGREAEIQFVVDAAFPTHLLMSALGSFAGQNPGTHVQLREVILSGASDALLIHDADLVIGIEMPSKYLADQLLEIEFIAVAHPGHALHQLDRQITARDLDHHMHVVIRDSGLHDKINVGWLSAQQRWTVSSIDSALSAIEHGLGYGWLPAHRLTESLQQNRLKPLLLEQGASYKTHLFMSFGHLQNIGPATRELAEMIKNTVKK